MKVIDKCPICDCEDLEKSPAVVMPFITYRIFGWTPKKITPECQLHSLECGSSYQICSSTLCHKCQLLFSDLRFDKPEMEKLYHEYRGENYVEQRKRFEPNYIETNDYLLKPLHYLSKVEDFIGRHTGSLHRILDWGGGNGVNTPFLTDRSEVSIYDISSHSNSELPNGANVINHLEGKENHFDLIVAMHVFEHLSDPRDELFKLIEKLRLGGSIYIEVPLESIMEFDGPKPDAINEKHHWHEHINFFSRPALQHLFDVSGLEVKDIREFDVSDEYRSFKILSAIAEKV